MLHLNVPCVKHCARLSIKWLLLVFVFCAVAGATIQFNLNNRIIYIQYYNSERVQTVGSMVHAIYYKYTYAVKKGQQNETL